MAAAAVAPHFVIANLVFENRTRLDAAQFDTVDQHGSSFHVIVAKAAYLLGARDASGTATLTPVPDAKLNVEDRYFDDDQHASVRQESDFAPYKPACDVIVNATAYAPAGPPAPAFQVRLTLHNAQHAPVIDKSLGISGEHSFEKKTGLGRVAQAAGKIATFGKSDPNPWRLTPALGAANLPLRYAYANGGQCRIDEGASAAHESSGENPCGRGFTRRWYLNATQITAIAAPQISAVGMPMTAAQFWDGANGAALPAPAGMGIVGRGWLPRRALAGRFEDKEVWGKDEVPRLPVDFDFAWYNCAPRDQQCPYLGGQEKFSLHNLCSRDHPSGSVDAKGNTVLQFALPRDQLFLIATDGDGKIWIERMVIDTVTIEPDANRVDLVWRVLLATGVDFRVAQIRQIHEAAQVARLDQMLHAQEVISEGIPDDK